MSQSRVTKAQASREQITYANLLFYGSWFALLVMLVTYLIYIFGIIKPYIPLDQVQRYWNMPVHEYVEKAKIPIGWGWATMLHRADFLNFLGIALLGGMTIICFFTLIPVYFKKKDWAFFIITVSEVIILAFAASGLIGVGH